MSRNATQIRKWHDVFKCKGKTACPLILAVIAQWTFLDVSLLSTFSILNLLISFGGMLSYLFSSILWILHFSLLTTHKEFTIPLSLIHSQYCNIFILVKRMTIQGDIFLTYITKSWSVWYNDNCVIFRSWKYNNQFDVFTPSLAAMPSRQCLDYQMWCYLRQTWQVKRPCTTSQDGTRLKTPLPTPLHNINTSF